MQMFLCPVPCSFRVFREGSGRPGLILRPSAGRLRRMSSQPFSSWIRLISACLLGGLLLRAADGPLTLSAVALVPEQGLQFRSAGVTGMVFSLQTSSDLVSWGTLTFTNSDSGEASFLDPGATDLIQRFYRVRQDPPPPIWLTHYHGWSNVIILNNGWVEAVVVPTINRVLQLRFVGEENGPFWENRAMDGRLPSATSWNTPGSFGGDKVWPAPQSLWNWPPPRAFDSMSVTASVVNGVVTLISPVDTTYGTRVVRRVELHPFEPLMRIVSRFEKFRGATNNLSVWGVTQCQSPERVFAPVPSPSEFAPGYATLSGSRPPSLVLSNQTVSLTRSTSSSFKIGNDAGELLWVGTNQVLHLQSPRVPGVPKSGYPDGGCSAEVYTNPNPTPYVELEVLSPLKRLGTNDTLEATCLYTLYRRTEPTAWDEAWKFWAP